MISVIICSADRARFAAAGAMYKAAMGAYPWELIGIHDARSLAEGFNRAVAASHGDVVIFSHDDVEVLSPDLPGRLLGHLEQFDLIGVVGTNRLIGGRWILAGPPYIFGQICHVHQRGELVVDIYGVPRKTIAGIMALDGVFMAARRSVLQKIGFDAATFDGFHLYDIDFSFAAHQAGFKLGVVNDINLLHHSGGQFDQVWQSYFDRFARKWQGRLFLGRTPLFQAAGVMVPSRAAAVEVMTPFYWQEP